MRDYQILHRRLARLETETRERAQQEEHGVSVVFLVPDVDGEAVPADAPPADADGLRAYRFYLLPGKR